MLHLLKKKKLLQHNHLVTNILYNEICIFADSKQYLCISLLQITNNIFISNEQKEKFKFYSVNFIQNKTVEFLKYIFYFK